MVKFQYIGQPPVFIIWSVKIKNINNIKKQIFWGYIIMVNFSVLNSGGQPANVVLPTPAPPTGESPETEGEKRLIYT